MPGPVFIVAARGVFTVAAKMLTLTTPTSARSGDVLVALIVHANSDSAAATPAGWTLAGTVGSGIRLDVYTHMIGDERPSVAFSLSTTNNEWQGELIALRSVTPTVVLEASAVAAFSATTALTTAGVTSQQAISLVLSLWSCAGSSALTLPVGFTLIDTFYTALATSRSLLIGYRLAGATGALTFASATAAASTSGSSFTLALRDRLPIQPAALVDLVPGNIGLIGKDTRAVR